MLYHPLETTSLTCEKNNEAYANLTYRTIRSTSTKHNINDISIDTYNNDTIKKQNIDFINALDVPSDKTKFNIIIFCYDALAEITDAILNDPKKTTKLRRFLYHENLQKIIFLVSKECECASNEEPCNVIREKIINHIGQKCQDDKAREEYNKYSSRIDAYCIQDAQISTVSKRNHFVMISPLEIVDFHHAQIWLEEHPEDAIINKAEKLTNAWGSEAWTSLSCIVEKCLKPYDGVWMQLNLAKSVPPSYFTQDK